MLKSTSSDHHMTTNFLIEVGYIMPLASGILKLPFV